MDNNTFNDNEFIFFRNRFFKLITDAKSGSLLKVEGVKHILGMNNTNFTLDKLYKFTSDYLKNRTFILDSTLYRCIEQNLEFRLKFKNSYLTLDFLYFDRKQGGIIIERYSRGREFDQLGIPKKIEHLFLIKSRVYLDYIPSSIQFHNDEGKELTSLSKILLEEALIDLFEALPFRPSHIDIMRIILANKGNTDTKNIAEKRGGKGQRTVRHQKAGMIKGGLLIVPGLNSEAQIARFVKGEIPTLFEGNKEL